MIKYAATFSLLFLLLTGVAQAASSDFHIRLNVNNDVTPPTTPQNLTATPVAYSQIDLSWDPSTDDSLLGGYQVFRDAVQIATTTLTTYSDTGLTASTTYSYYVKAYDSVFNISSSSNVVATTTHAVLATSTPTTTVTEHKEPGGSGPGNVKLESFSIVPALYSAQVTWQTNLYAQFELWWGRTSSYELGFVSNDLFKRSDTTSITDLQPGTVYEYQLVAYDKNGIRTVISHGEFKTLNAPDTTAPANVSDLRANIEHGGDVKLSWINPTDPDFDHVRIIRNYLFYPTDPYDGFIAYQDKGTSYVDRGVLDDKDIQYYTVFSYDNNGNVSSGATVEIKSPRYQETPQNQSTSTSSSTTLTFNDVDFMQNGEEVAPSEIDADVAFTIRIVYEKLPEHLKTIQAIFTDPHNPSKGLSFLLKINKDKSYYEATVGALHDEGIYPVRVVVYDYQLQTLTRLNGSITASHKMPSNVGGGLTGRRMNIPPIDIFFLFIFLSILAYILYRKLKNIDFEPLLLGNRGRTKITISALMFFVFGGSCAYILATLLRVGMVASSRAGNVASVVVSKSSNTADLLPAAVILMITFLIVLGVSFAQDRSKK